MSYTGVRHSFLYYGLLVLALRLNFESILVIVMVFRLKLRVNLVSISYWTKFDSNFSYSISFR